MKKLFVQKESAICSSLDQIAPLIFTDSSGIILTVNSKFSTLFGSDSQSLKGMDIRSCLSEPYASEPIGPTSTSRREVQFLSKSGFGFWLELNIFPIEIESGGKEGYLWIGFDVTERKSTEQYLAESQLFSKSLMQTAPVGIFVTNSSGGCTYVNGCWTQQSGMNGSKAKGNGWQLFLHPDDKDAVIRDWSALVQNKTSFVNRQYRYARSDGKEVWILSSATSLYDTNQAIVGYLRIEQDITDRLQNEKIIREQQHVVVTSSKMSALGEMAGGVAHEINNPLATIKMIAGQLQEVLDDDPLDKPLVKSMASQIEETSNRIAKIVNGLRLFSRDGSKDRYQAVNVHQLIQETLSFCSERFKNNGITVTVDDFKEDVCFEGRSTEISQVLLNLLNNANDAIEGLGEKWIRISILEQTDELEIQVTDSGRGIPAEVREKIFQPFFTTKEIGKGTGMGLSISSGIVQNHHGKLKVDLNYPNTRFLITLPKRQKA